MSACIFCNIIEGKISVHKIFEDDQFLAILDINPIITGHALVITKKHYRWVHEVEEFGDYWEAAKKVAQAQLSALGADTVVFATAGFEVPHAHIHVIPAPPRHLGEVLPGVESAKRLTVTAEELTEIARKLQAHL